MKTNQIKIDDKRIKCPNCKVEFRPRRSNQKFCSSKCRSRYHNKNYAIERKEILPINKVFQKNYRILKYLYKEGSYIVSKDFLLGKGFHFGFSTHFEQIDETQNALSTYYKYQLESLGNGKFRITKSNQSY